MSFAAAFAAAAFPSPLVVARDSSPNGIACKVKAKPVQAGRNEPCPCGSGKKFKRCCLRSEPTAESDWPQ